MLQPSPLPTTKDNSTNLRQYGKSVRLCAAVNDDLEKGCVTTAFFSDL